MRRLVAAVVVILGTFASPAVADDDRTKRGRQCRNQCGNENSRDCYQAEAPCSDDDLSPSFDKSPVEDSFDPTICVLPDSCRFDGERESEASA